MGKAVLVIKMPKGCIGCKFYAYVLSRCNVTDKFQNDISADFKPEWCPLRTLPEQREEKAAKDVGLRDVGFIDGWNAYRDEVLGGAE